MLACNRSMDRGMLAPALHIDVLHRQPCDDGQPLLDVQRGVSGHIEVDRPFSSEVKQPYPSHASMGAAAYGTWYVGTIGSVT
jgi:hypothetical protein